MTPVSAAATWCGFGGGVCWYGGCPHCVVVCWSHASACKVCSRASPGSIVIVSSTLRRLPRALPMALLMVSVSAAGLPVPVGGLSLSLSLSLTYIHNVQNIQISGIAYIHNIHTKQTCKTYIHIHL